MSRQLCALALSLFVVLVVGVPSALSAAEKKPNTAWMEAGKADTKASFAKQAASAPKPAAWPTIIGEYLWGGRADDQYKPFHMFELRVRGATKATEATKYRIITLDPARKPQSTGPWVALGKLNPGETRDLSYKMNCPTFPAFQVEIAWKGADGKEAQETYLAWDKVAMLPVALSEVAHVPFVINLNQNFDHDATKKVATVSYTLWNIGGQPAKDVVQTLHFKNDANKVVYSHEIKPAKGETIRELPSGYIGEVKLSVPKVPPFAYLSIATKMSDATTIEAGGFTGANDVEIAHVRAEGKQLKAKVRNGYKTPVAGVVVTITLTDSNGKAVKALSLPAGDLKPGEERELSADISTVGSWSGYEVGWKSSDLPPATPSAPKNQALPVINVDGVEFTVTATRPDKEGLAVSGILRNKRDADLDGFVVTFTVPNGKDEALVTLKPGKLPKGDDGLEVDFTAVGVKAFTGLSLKWVASKKQ